MDMVIDFPNRRLEDLPNEILYEIFEYVLSDRKYKEIYSCFFISKKFYFIVRRVYDSLKKRKIYTTSGFSINYRGFSYLGCKKPLFDALPLFICDALKQDLSEIIKSNKGPLKSEKIQSIDLYLDKFDMVNKNTEPLKLLKNGVIRYFFNKWDDSDVILNIDMNTNFWNDSEIIIDYPFGVYNWHHEIYLSRIYRSEKGYFTLGDIIERIQQFYSEGFTVLEYRIFIEGIWSIGTDMIKETPNSLNIVDRLKKAYLHNNEIPESYTKELIEELEDFKVLKSLLVEDQLIYIMVKMDKKKYAQVNEFIKLIRENKISKYDITTKNKLADLLIVGDGESFDILFEGE